MKRGKSCNVRNGGMDPEKVSDNLLKAENELLQIISVVALAIESLRAAFIEVITDNDTLLNAIFGSVETALTERLEESGRQLQTVQQQIQQRLSQELSSTGEVILRVQSIANKFNQPGGFHGFPQTQPGIASQDSPVGSGQRDETPTERDISEFGRITEGFRETMQRQTETMPVPSMLQIPSNGAGSISESERYLRSLQETEGIGSESEATITTVTPSVCPEVTELITLPDDILLATAYLSLSKKGLKGKRLLAALAEVITNPTETNIKTTFPFRTRLNEKGVG